MYIYIYTYIYIMYYVLYNIYHILYNIYTSRWLHSNLNGSQYHVKISAKKNKNTPSVLVMSPFSEWRRSEPHSKAECPSMAAVTMHVSATHCAVA